MATTHNSVNTPKRYKKSVRLVVGLVVLVLGLAIWYWSVPQRQTPLPFGETGTQ
jgi:4-amino-4-deoxy-L-arabinose transferase-like glycosyltransferase